MEIQIPVAEQDTATESQPTLTDRTGYQTDGTGYQTISDNWSREGQVSTSALTSRSLAASSVSQPPLDPTAETDDENFGASQDKDESGELDSARCGDASPSNTGNPSGGGEDEIIEDPDGSEKSHRSTAEEEAGGNSATPIPSVGSNQQEGEDGEDTEIATQKPSETVGTEQQNQILEAEENDAKANSSDTQEVQNDDDQPSVDQTQEDDFVNTGADLESKGSEDNALGKAGEVDISEDKEEEKEPNSNDLEKPQSERDKKVFLTENDNPDESSDISDVRAETPNWAEEEEEEGKEEKEAVSLLEEDEIRQKQDCLSMTSHARPLTRSSLHEDIVPGHRAVVNTPVSYYTATEINAEISRNIESRNTSHVETAREAAFQHAMTLMSSRCESTQEKGEEGALFGFDDTSYGYKYPQYFYVQQRKPAPMAPLKVWKGYHGNVYFEPIQISSVAGGKDEKGDREGTCTPASALSRSKSSASRRRTMTATTTRSQAVVPVSIPGDRESAPLTDTRSPTRSTTRVTIKRGPTSAKSVASSRSVAAISQHHILYLDKQAVTNPDNSAMHEELQVMEKQQSTGSLNIQPRSIFPHDFGAGGGSTGGSEKGRTVMTRRSGTSSAKFDRICRGSVAHKLRRAKSGGLLGNSMSRGANPNPWKNREDPAPARQRSVQSSTELMVVGDRFSATSLLSPLLRTQTQFSLSNQRMTVNSPDLYGAFDRLPPLEQVRISLRHMNAHGDDGFGNRVASPYSTGTSVGVVEELKPFIKYSPDVRAQFNRQIKYY